MRYIQRDANGVIVGVYMNPQPLEDGTFLTLPEPVSEEDPDVIDYFSRALSKDL